MTTRVLETTRVQTALDLSDLLAVLQETIRELDPDMDLDTVYLGVELNVSVLVNTLSDGSKTVDLQVTPVDPE